jgi:enoyl-CoA hydratase
MGFDTLDLAVENGVAWLTFNRPKVLNAFNERMSAELRQVTEQLAVDDGVRVLVVRGAGDHFMGGADIGMLQQWSKLDAGELRKTLLDGFSPTLLEKMPQPVIGAVDGFALGMGFEVALACDFRIATERAVFGLPEITLGLIPGAGGSQRLPRLVGRGRAAEVAMVGARIDAATAERWGVANRAVAPEALDGAVEDLVGSLVKKSPLALRRVKESLVGGAERGLADGIALELDLFVATVLTEDAREGTAAFLEKRRPEFVGR